MTVRMSPQVRSLLGPQMAAEATQALLDGGVCISCKQPISATEDASVVLGQGPAGQVGALWYTHERCRDSGVIALPPEAVEAMVTPVDGHDMRMTPLIFPTGPALLAEVSHRVVSDAGTPGAEVTSVVVAGLLGRGATLVTEPGQDVDELAGWSGVLAPHGRALSLLILDDTGTVFFTGTIAPPPGWQRSALAARGCTLLVTDWNVTGRGGNDGGDDDVQRQSALAAARAGRLVGGRITIGRRTGPGA